MEPNKHYYLPNKNGTVALFYRTIETKCNDDVTRVGLQYHSSCGGGWMGSLEKDKDKFIKERLKLMADYRIKMNCKYGSKGAVVGYSTWFIASELERDVYFEEIRQVPEDGQGFRNNATIPSPTTDSWIDDNWPFNSATEDTAEVTTKEESNDTNDFGGYGGGSFGGGGASGDYGDNNDTDSSSSSSDCGGGDD